MTNNSSNNNGIVQVSDITELDVLSGRGNGTNHQNVQYRHTVADYAVKYRMAVKQYQRRAVAKEVIDEVECKGGRFLCKKKRESIYYDSMTMQEKYIKVMQSLRDEAKKNKHAIATATVTATATYPANTTNNNNKNSNNNNNNNKNIENQPSIAMQMQQKANNMNRASLAASSFKNYSSIMTMLKEQTRNNISGAASFSESPFGLHHHHSRAVSPTLTILDTIAIQQNIARLQTSASIQKQKESPLIHVIPSEPQDLVKQCLNHRQRALESNAVHVLLCGLRNKLVHPQRY